jgi:hypothetical protein
MQDARSPICPEQGAGNNEHRPSTRVRVRVRVRARVRARSLMREAESLSFGRTGVPATRPLPVPLPEVARYIVSRPPRHTVPQALAPRNDVPGTPAPGAVIGLLIASTI